jgi:hypothetical protein
VETRGDIFGRSAVLRPDPFWLHIHEEHSHHYNHLYLLGILFDDSKITNVLPS